MKATNYPSKEIIDNSDLIFEGRVLSDSVYFQNSPGRVYTCHNILVLKQFKGSFKSDVLSVVTYGGKMVRNGQEESTFGAYAFMGDEAIFCVNIMKLGNQDPNLFYVLYGYDGGFVKVCDKKDVVKEVYDPIEAVTGQPYVDVHPNTCKPQQK
jgi:hypothetical protein